MVIKATKVCILLMALVSFGCSLITNFDPALLEDEDGGDLYSIAANLPDPIEVILQGDDATIVLSLDDPIPDVDEDLIYDTIVESIGLTVINEETGVSTHLTEGRYVEGQPNAPGEYTIEVSEDRYGISTRFVNETVGGQAMREDGDYRALVEVAPNDIFETDVLVRDVVVASAP